MAQIREGFAQNSAAPVLEILSADFFNHNRSKAVISSSKTGSVLRLLFEHYPTAAGVALALLLIFWPPPNRAVEEEMRQARLAELRAGAEESYYEERRELEAYGPNSAGPFRFLGFLLFILSIAPLFL